MPNSVNIINEKNYNLENLPTLANKILDETLKQINKNNICEVAVIFIDENEGLELNKKYRNKDYIPDVLSFANQMDIFNDSEEESDLGDVFICYNKALKQSQDYEHSLTRELCFLFLHGLLHNLGYDHEIESDEKIMFALQKEILNNLKIFRN